MKKIVLLTSEYPWGKGESFIISELEAVASCYDIDVVAVNSIEKKCSSRSLSPNTNACQLFSKKFCILQKLRYIVKCLLSVEFYKEILLLKKKKKLCLIIIRDLIAYMSRGERIFNALRKKYLHILLEKPEDFLLYSYWLHDTSYAAAKIAAKYGCYAVSRAHGGDLYEERSSKNYLPLRKFSFEHLNGIYPVSVYGEKYLKQKYGFVDKIKHSYLGTLDYGIRVLTPTNGIFRIITCSYLISLKRVDLFAKALSLLTDYSIEWVHFGDGPERENITKIAQLFNNKIKFLFCGNMTNKEIMNYYKEHDVYLFVNVSSTEGIPVSIMEAMSFGIPVLATDVGGTHEIVIDGYNGRLITANISVSDLSNSIESIILLDHNAYLKLRQNARRYWHSNFDAKTNYLSFYRNITLYHKSEGY